MLGSGFEYVVQEKQAGTGHAVLQVAPLLEGFDGDVLVLPGDAPLLTSEVLDELVQRHQASGAAATILTAIVPDPGSYGRIVRDSGGKVIKIVERRDAALQEVQIREINSGTYCFRAKMLMGMLPDIDRHNAQGEYYLTDVIGLLFARNMPVETLLVRDHRVVLGVNNRRELADAMHIFRQRVLEELMLSGVTVIDPMTTYVEAAVEIGNDSIIYPFTVIEKGTKIGSGCRVGPHARVARATIGEGSVVESSVIVNSTVAPGTVVPPFTVMRDGHVQGSSG